MVPLTWLTRKIPRPLEDAIGFTIHTPCSLVKATIHIEAMYALYIYTDTH